MFSVTIRFNCTDFWVAISIDYETFWFPQFITPETLTKTI